MDVLSVTRENLAQRTHCLLEVVGFVDSTTVSTLERALRECGRDGLVDVFLDMTQVGYVSSAGWGAMVTAIRNLREAGGDLKLVGMQRDVDDVFRLLQFSSILESYPDLASAQANPV